MYDIIDLLIVSRPYTQNRRHKPHSANFTQYTSQTFVFHHVSITTFYIHVRVYICHSYTIVVHISKSPVLGDAFLMTRIKILYMFYILLYNFTYFYTFYMSAPHTLHKPRAQQTRSCHTSWRSRDSGARLMKSSRHNLLPSTTRVPPSLPNQKRSHLFQFPDTKFEIM